VPRLFAALLLLGLRAGAAELPPGLPEVTLGMTQEALLAARPRINRKNFAGTLIPAGRPHNTWFELLGPEAWPYNYVNYEVAGGSLVAVSLHGHPKAEDLNAARLQAVATARALWGQRYTTEVDASNLYFAPALLWETGGRSVRLVLPTGNFHGGKISMNVLSTLLEVRLASAPRPSRGTETVMAADKRAKLFEYCGVEDRPAKAAGPGFEELKAAPQTVLIDGREVILTAYLRREFAKHPAQDGDPMTADFTAIARDRTPLPEGLRFDAAWVWQYGELWTIPSLATRGLNHDKTELSASAAGGPRWPGIRTKAVVRLIGRDGRAVLLAAPERDLVYGNFR
jgi:hypothetical protein